MRQQFVYGKWIDYASSSCVHGNPRMDDIEQMRSVIEGWICSDCGYGYSDSYTETRTYCEYWGEEV